MSSSTSRALLQLVRAPLAATAIADGATGYLLATVRTTTSSDPVVPRALALAAVASTALYWGGMALNDYFDRERDATLYPQRPIPSGRVPARTALAVGAALLLLGIGAAALAGGAWPALYATVVAFCILAYDGFLKRFRLPGSVAMASCRVANVLLGGVIALSVRADTLPPERLYVFHAAVIGVYVFAITLLSTFEEADAPASALLLAGAALFAVPVVLALALLEARPSAWPLPFLVTHLLLVTAVVLNAAKRGTKAAGHVTVRWLLRGLLLVDAAALAGVGRIDWAVVAVLLIVPNVLGAALLFRGPPPALPGSTASATL